MVVSNLLIPILSKKFGSDVSCKISEEDMRHCADHFPVNAVRYRFRQRGWLRKPILDIYSESYTGEKDPGYAFVSNGDLENLLNGEGSIPLRFYIVKNGKKIPKEIFLLLQRDLRRFKNPWTRFKS